MIRRSNSIFLLAVTVVAVQAAVLFWIIPQVSAHVTSFYNQDRFVDGYDLLAANLVQGHGYRFFPDTALTMMREPGYPILLSGLLLAFGSSFVAVKMANMLLALATAWLMTRLARRISSNRWLLVLPPLLFLFHPATLIAESRGGVEILFAFLIMLFILAVYSAMDSNTWSRYALAGAVLGLTVLVRSTPMLFPIFLLGYLFVVDRQRTPMFAICRNVAIMIVSMVVILSPWIARNYALTGRFVPTASVLGVSAHAGQYICTHYSEDKPWVVLDHEAAMERSQLAREQGYHFKDGYYQGFYTSADELSFSAFLAKRVFTEYKEDPLMCANCMAHNLFNFWFAGKSRMSTTMNVVAQLPYLILAGIGIVVCVRNKRFTVIGPFLLLIIYFLAVYIPILAQARYSIPLIPFLSILAAIALVPASLRTSNILNSTHDQNNSRHSGVPLPDLASVRLEKA